MAPDLEVCSLISTANVARQLAGRGSVTQGRSALMRGHERALRLAREGRVWSRELVTLWSSALEEYGAQFER
jgi:hypothetical protein